MSDDRDHNSPQYKAFRYSVLSRDSWTCQLTGKKTDLEVHHIIPWAIAPNLRYTMSNGITLCKEAHGLVTGREKEYEEQLRRIIDQKKHESRRGRIPAPYVSKAKSKWRPSNPRLRF